MVHFNHVREKKVLTCRAKDISPGKFPHAGKQLDETSSENCHAYDDIGSSNATGLDVDEGENECSRREGEKTAVQSPLNLASVKNVSVFKLTARQD